jgi:hypothetical protein
MPATSSAQPLVTGRRRHPRTTRANVVLRSSTVDDMRQHTAQESRGPPNNDECARCCFLVAAPGYRGIIRE